MALSLGTAIGLSLATARVAIAAASNIVIVEIYITCTVCEHLVTQINGIGDSPMAPVGGH
jgi:hypothetical protein